MRLKITIPILLLVCSGTFAASNASSDLYSLSTEINLVRSDTRQPIKDRSNTVVWLVPLDTQFENATKDDPHFRMEQKDKHFVPDLLVVPVGSYVDFPNLDPWFHNVFSLFRGKKFDLGLYQAGAQRSVRFDKPGVSYLFCNIHPEMSSVIVAIESKWFGVSDANGKVKIVKIPEGTYVLHVWHQYATPDELKGLQRTVEIKADRVLNAMTVAILPQARGHKNKYGKDYDPDVLNPEY